MFHAVNQALGGHDTLTASVNRRRALLTYRGTRTEARMEQGFTALQTMGDHGFTPLVTMLPKLDFAEFMRRALPSRH